MEEDREVPLILGRAFLATGRALIDIQEGKLELQVQEEKVTFNIFEATKFPTEADSCFRVEVIKDSVATAFQVNSFTTPLEAYLMNPKIVEEWGDNSLELCHELMEAQSPKLKSHIEALDEKEFKPSKDEPPKLELK